MSLQLLSHAEQVANHLCDQISGGRWKGEMPGVAHLKNELGVNHVTINSALQLLEKQGVLASQGSRRRRMILGNKAPRKNLSIRILLYDKQSRQAPHNIELLDKLHQAGFVAHFARKTLGELGMDPTRVARFVRQTEADAWVVVAASSEVLGWFAAQSFPCIAMFGRFTGLPIAAASPRKIPALLDAVRRLVQLGHQRIVMLVREERRKPYPALAEQAFLDELKAQGIATGSYNLPDWESHPAGLGTCLDSLFRHTPPTALICDEPRVVVAAQQHLAHRGIFAPQHFSLICSDPDPAISWCQPAIAHIDWDHRPVVQRVVRWARNTANGKADRKQSMILGKLVEGGTIGPAPAVS